MRSPGHLRIRAKKAGTLEGDIGGRGRKTKVDEESSPTKDFSVDGPKVKSGALSANIFHFWTLTNDQ